MPSTRPKGILDRILRRSGSPEPQAVMEKSLTEIHEYWRRPDDGNRPEAYLNPKGGQTRSEFLLELVGDAERDGPVLEVGCNVGRNLAHLAAAGFTDLTGVEISEDAVRLLRESYPELADARVVVDPAETALRRFADREFSLVYTMAVLVHIHPDSKQAVLDEVARVCADRLIVIESEKKPSHRHFPCDYLPEFERRGFRQISETPCSPETTGLPASYVARVFRR